MLLLLMANFGKDGKAEPIKTKIDQATLAEMIGTTRSRVSTFMNKFRKLGFIDYNGDIYVHNSLLNVLLYDDPEMRRDVGLNFRRVYFGGSSPNASSVFLASRFPFSVPDLWPGQETIDYWAAALFLFATPRLPEAILISLPVRE
jgi:hypothetical protein